jgi:hypothetical protein
MTRVMMMMKTVMTAPAVSMAATRRRPSVASRVTRARPVDVAANTAKQASQARHSTYQLDRIWRWRAGADRWRAASSAMAADAAASARPGVAPGHRERAMRSW